MSQSRQTDSAPGKATYQHNEDAQFDVEFGLFWRDLEMGAKLNTVGTAAREGAKKVEVFIEKLIQLTKIVASAAVAITLILAIKAISKSKL